MLTKYLATYRGRSEDKVQMMICIAISKLSFASDSSSSSRLFLSAISHISRTLSYTSATISYRRSLACLSPSHLSRCVSGTQIKKLKRRNEDAELDLEDLDKVINKIKGNIPILLDSLTGEPRAVVEDVAALIASVNNGSSPVAP